MRFLRYMFLGLVLTAACSRPVSDMAGQPVDYDFNAMVRTEIEPFIEEGEHVGTKVNLAGNQFESGDLMRLRIIAPYSSSSEYGENTWGGSFDNWYLMTWGGANANWTAVGSGRGFDINNDFKTSGSPSPTTLSQATPYVFTATTWTKELHFVLTSSSDANGVVTTFSNIFYADQRNVADYKASDVLWAQQFMQSCTDNVRLNFRHKMAALHVSVPSDFVFDESAEVVLTLENMPDIDQQEICIGNYYASRIKSNPSSALANYGERVRSACSKENNGKVLGIVVYDKANGRLSQVAIESLDQTATYTARRDGRDFYFIIPPYTVPEEVAPVLWLRNGTSRWSAPLALPAGRTFESGVRYNVSMVKYVAPVVDPEGPAAE